MAPLDTTAASSRLSATPAASLPPPPAASSFRVRIEDVPDDSDVPPASPESMSPSESLDSSVTEVFSDNSDQMWLDEDSLSAADQAAIRSLAMFHNLSLTVRQYQEIPRYMRSAPLPSIKHAQTRTSKLSGVSGVAYDCCVNVCCCFTGDYAALTRCPFCKVSRFCTDGKPRKQFIYIPCTPRLRSQYANPQQAEGMRYRSQQGSNHGSKYEDYMDGSHYRYLRKEKVVIDGVEQTYYFFSNGTDIALALSADGFCPWKKRRATCWPLLLINLNLPPEERYKKENVISLGAIPGNKQPRDFDSFLWPFVQEMLQLAHGVDAYDAHSDSPFTLRAYLIIVFGDLQAMSKLTRMKGVNGLCPCRFCTIRAIPDPAGTNNICYLPHDRRAFPEEASYSTSNLPLRTHDQMIQQAARIDSLRPTEKARQARETGIKGTPILSRLPGISLPFSFPSEFMHLVWLDLIPLLISLYSGDSKGLGEGTGEYRLNTTAWQNIGKATKAAGDTIPAPFGRRVPDLADESGYRTAETWSVWTLYIAPALLKGRFRRQRYYRHFLDLVRLLNLCIKLELSRDEVSEIRRGFARWVEQFEEYFYQYNSARVSLCTSIIHYLLHIADSIEHQGPVWVYWSFVMERHCGRLSRAIRSRRHPWAALNHFIVVEAQLHTLRGMYRLDDTFFVGTPTAVRQPGSFRRLPAYDTCELLAPSRVSDLDEHLASQIANVLSAWYMSSSDKKTRDAIKRHLPSRIEEWGKVRRLDGGDMMHAADLIRREERDMTYIRYEQLEDKNKRHAYQPVILERKRFYGQLRRILVLEVSPALARILGPDVESSIAIAAVAECQNLTAPDAAGLQFFSGVREGLELTDLRTVECVVGRVPTHSGKEWAIVDRSDALSRVLFTADAMDTDGP